MPRTSPYNITLAEAERAELEARARRYTSSYSDVVRARIVLYAADGLGRVSQFSGAHAGVNDCTGQQDAAEVGQGVFVVAGRDAAPLLEPVEAALDGVS